VVNLRKCSTELSCNDIRELEAAKDYAKIIGHELNTHLIFTPYLDDNDIHLVDVPIPSPSDVAATFGRLLKHVSVWVRRRGVRFTYIRVAHSSDDETRHNPHLHVFMHLPASGRTGIATN
jgi:hypothetical protein